VTTFDVPFGSRTTLRVGGDARQGIDVTTADELVALSETIAATTPVYVIGRGSNTLVADAGFDGILIHLGESFSEIVIDEDAATIRVGAAADLPVVARRSVDVSLTGFEWAVGVPGSIGGAVKMNAGGHGSSMSESVVSATVFDLDTGEFLSLGNDALTFSYRHSGLESRQIVVEATLRLSPGDREEGAAMLKDIVQWRRANQPGGSNCGSVFTNPPHESAGRLIEQAGCKGMRIGSAQVSEKHANFIQADPGGSGDDVRRLLEKVRAMVLAECGIELATEVKMVGFSPDAVVGGRP
jgi:UDP-N-acetylmuramate dehydrogenase